MGASFNDGARILCDRLLGRAMHLVRSELPALAAHQFGDVLSEERSTMGNEDLTFSYGEPQSTHSL